MSKTTLSIRGQDFLINGKLTYSEIAGSNPSAHGLLMNARFIQGIYDDSADRQRYARWGRGEWDPEAHTDELCAALPEWHRHGLRAITVGFQGGGPFFTIPNHEIDNNPFGEDGSHLDPAYAGRMDRLIRAADKVGMVIVVSYLYQGQAPRLRDGRAIRNAVVGASRFLREGGYTNVIVEPANEHEIGNFRNRPIVGTQEGIVSLMDLARAETKGAFAVGCSGGGGTVEKEVAQASDVVLVHGNGCTRQQYRKAIMQLREWCPDKPIVCNEDSQAIGQLKVAFETHTSWGYYNNMTKQEPPADWGITCGEDQFFAYRVAEGVGIALPPIAPDDQYYLQGLEPEQVWQGKRWLRLASLYPESIDFVEFYRNGALVDVCYDEPFCTAWRGNWIQGSVEAVPGDTWRADVHLRDGAVVSREGCA